MKDRDVLLTFISLSSVFRIERARALDEFTCGFGRHSTLADSCCPRVSFYAALRGLLPGADLSSRHSRISCLA
jgi:hypothetical protein